jgi:hypothetical protein
MFSFPLRVTADANVASANFISPGAAPSGCTDSPVESNRLGSTLPVRDDITSLPTWQVGEPEYDEFMAELGIAPDILRRFAELDYTARLNIMRSTFQTKPQHPNAWMERCNARTFEDRDKRRSQPYRRGASFGNSPKAGSADLSPASQGSACSVSSPSKFGSNAFARVDRSPGQSSSMVASPLHGQLRRASSRLGAEVKPPEWILHARLVMENRSEVLTLFLPNLQSDALDRFCELPNEIQALLATSCVFNPCAWHQG